MRRASSLSTSGLRSFFIEWCDSEGLIRKGSPVHTGAVLSGQGENQNLKVHGWGWDAAPRGGV